MASRRERRAARRSEPIGSGQSEAEASPDPSVRPVPIHQAVERSQSVGPMTKYGW